MSEMPMERDGGAAHGLEPGKDNMPGRSQGSSLLPSSHPPTPPLLSDPSCPAFALSLRLQFCGVRGGGSIQEREVRMGGWEGSGSQMRKRLN